MGLTPGNLRPSIADYLTAERASPDKHEYRDGEIRLMAGASGDHCLIVANLVRRIGEKLDGTPCRVYSGDLRIRVPRTVLYTYPGVTVICGQRETDPNDSSGETFTNPRLIIEVISPSTEGYDRGEKFDRYRQLDSLAEYVLVSQTAPFIQTFFRQPGGTWLFSPYAGLDSQVAIRSLDISLSMADVFAGVEFPPA
jgi:Uma2 family endonuclease